MDDQQAISRYLRDGDDSAFATLVWRHYGKVFRLAVSILGPGMEAEAEEVAQEVFLQVSRKLTEFQGRSQFSTWLYRVAYNRALNWRSRARWQRPHLPEKVLEACNSGHPSPEGRLARKEHLQAVAQCLQDMPPLYRSVLHLHYWMETPVSEIAQLLGAPTNTVKSYLYRARAMLEKRLKGKGIDHA